MDEYLTLPGLLHPDGPRPASVIGSGWAHGEEGTGDVIVLAPAGPELSDSWLERAVEQAGAELAPDGLLYVLAPRSVERVVARHGLVVESRFLHVPDVRESRFVVSLEGEAAQTLSSWVPHHHWRQRLAQASLRWGTGAWAAERLLPVGLAVRRPDARPLLSWLGGRSVVLSSRTYGREGTAVVHRFRRRRRDVVVKVGLDPCSRQRRGREAGNLLELGEAARAAGARVPVGSYDSGMLTLNALEGRPVAQLLAGRQSRLPGTVENVTAWLQRWNCRTRNACGLDVEGLLSPLRRFAAPLGDGYLDWLQTQVDRCSVFSLPAVAAHNDLTMWNVLLAPGKGPAILDWEAAGAAGPPLCDLFYALTDATAAVDRYRGRLDAFRRVWSERWAREQVEGLRASLEIPRKAVPLLFHVCWLMHARDEAQKKRAVPSAARPFHEIVGMLAAHPDLGAWGD